MVNSNDRFRQFDRGKHNCLVNTTGAAQQCGNIIRGVLARVWERGGLMAFGRRAATRRPKDVPAQATVCLCSSLLGHSFL